MKKYSSLANTKFSFPSNFLLTEILIALERMRFFQYVEHNHNFSIKNAAKTLEVDEHLFRATCEFLAEKNVLSKIAEGSFKSNFDFKLLRRPIRFLTAYKEVFESMGELMKGEKRYGVDVVRDATYLGAGTALSIPLLVQWFKKLNIKSVLDIGCGRGDFLLALAEAIPDFHGIGVEIDEPTAKIAKEAVLNSLSKNSIKIIPGDAGFPENFVKEVESVDAIIGIAVFHEFDRDDNLIPTLKKYKNRFPASRLFIVEFDTPSWDNLRKEKESPAREQAAMYLLAHYFTNQGLPRGKSEWMNILKQSGWNVNQTKELLIRLTAFECA